MYEQILKDCADKEMKLNDLEYQDIVDKYGIKIHYDSLRKSQQTPFGSVAAIQYFAEKQKNKNVSSDDVLSEKLNELKKERVKLQTLNLERSRLDRNEARQEMYYEYVGRVIETLPLPNFNPISYPNHKEIEYVVAVSDVHYGAKFKSINNEYSPEIAKNRFNILTSRLIDFVDKKGITKLTIVSLGDLIQGILRLSDLRINDSSIVKATVEISRLIANMLNELSAYTRIYYYHVPSANHTQIRVLNAKASELADEDLEFLIGNYISDLCSKNDRIEVNLAESQKDFVEFDVLGNNLIALHGHQVKNVDSAIKNISMLHRKFYDCVLLGHYHTGKEIPSGESLFGDAEVLVSPSFVGSDPYSDKLAKGSKASVKIYGFEKFHGHTETYKIILN